MTRSQLIDEIEEIRDDSKYDKFAGRIEAILDSHGASEDDSDPYEGFYVTMSMSDIAAALKEIHNLISQTDANSAEYNKTVDALKKLGFAQQVASANGGDVVYFTKDDLGIIICDSNEARYIAYNFV